MHPSYLSTAQLAAIKHIENYARRLDSLEQRELPNALRMSNISRTAFEQAKRSIREYARIGLHFHPDRICKDGRTVVQALAEDGVYHNQFVTHVSNGKFDPVADGERSGWEDQMFGHAFSTNKASLSERPKYGALDLMLYPDGPCPRFGSCYLLLNPKATHRATFTYMDSHRAPLERGTLKMFDAIIAALITECFERRFALGTNDISPTQLIEHLSTRLSLPFQVSASIEPGRNLNHYIEAQVHGDILLQRDCCLLVVDPSYKGTKTEESFHRICDEYKLGIFWHSGFRLAVRDVPDNFRGPTMPTLAKRVGYDGYIDAQLIGEAAEDLKISPQNWADRGDYETVLQELKCLWHVLVQFGKIAM